MNATEAPTGVDDLVRRVAAFGLQHTRLALQAEQISEATWSALLRSMHAERLSGLLVEAVDAGAVHVSPERRTQAVDQHQRSMAWCLKLERRLLDVIEVFDRQGIDHRILKGAGTAHLDYPDPSLRGFGDVDVLVRSEQFDRAVRAVTSLGHERRFPQPRPGFDRRFTKSVALVSETGLEVDLHRNLALGPFGVQIDTDDLWRSEQTFELGGRRVRAFGTSMRLVHACYHAALGSPTPPYTTLRDIAQLCDGSTAPAFESVHELARRWDGEPVLARGVQLCWEALDLEPSGWSDWANGYVPNRADQRALRTYLDPEMGYAERSLASLRVMSMRDRLAFTWALAFPSGDYVRARYRGRLSRLSRTARRYTDRRSAGSPGSGRR